MFRGTSIDKSFQDVLHDAMIQPIKINLKSSFSDSSHFTLHHNICPYVYVHAGFFTAVENIYGDILSALQNHQVKSFYVTGHSLGGALAQIFGLKHMVLYPLTLKNLSEESSCGKVLHILTFASPMVLWCGETLSAPASKMLSPWRKKCLNFMYRADPVPLLPRMLSCKYCWNALVASATSQTNFIKSYLAQKYIAIPEEGDVPDSIFRTLTFTKGFSPPGLTAVLLGGGHRIGAEQEWATSVVLQPESFQKLSTSFDTYVRPEDAFNLHSMSNYVHCCLNNTAYCDEEIVE